MLQINNISVDNAIVFGKVRRRDETRDRHGNSPILGAKALRLIYVLRNAPESDQWIHAFIAFVSKTTSRSDAQLFYTSSISLPKEMERNGEVWKNFPLFCVCFNEEFQLLIPWMPWLVVVLVSFCAISCCTLDAVRSQPFIGLAAMANAFMAVCAAVATLLYLRYPYLHMVLIMPFLILCKLSIWYMYKFLLILFIIQPLA